MENETPKEPHWAQTPDGRVFGERPKTRFWAETPDGPVEVTEDVGALYDLVVGSMDFGSGFLTVEDAEPLARIADLGGYEQPGSGTGGAHGPSLLEQARRQIAARDASE